MEPYRVHQLFQPYRVKIGHDQWQITHEWIFLHRSAGSPLCNAGKLTEEWTACALKGGNVHRRMELDVSMLGKTASHIRTLQSSSRELMNGWYVKDPHYYREVCSSMCS
jgi:hypothetical protein